MSKDRFENVNTWLELLESLGQAKLFISLGCNSDDTIRVGGPTSKLINENCFKMWVSFEMCFHCQNVKGFVSVAFPFSKKQKSVHSLQIALLMRL